MNFCSINYSSLPLELCTLLLELQTLAKIPFSCWFCHKILLSWARGSWSVPQTRGKRMSILFYDENQHYGKKYPVCLNLILRCPLIFHELGVVIPTKKFLLPFGTALSGAWASCSCCLIRKIKVWRGWRGKNWEKLGVCQCWRANSCSLCLSLVLVCLGSGKAGQGIGIQTKIPGFITKDWGQQVLVPLFGSVPFSLWNYRIIIILFFSLRSGLNAWDVGSGLASDVY